MPLGAMGYQRSTPSDVFFMSYWLQMFWVDTGPVATQVV